MVRLIISSVNHGVDLFLLFACIFVFLFFVIIFFSKKKALDIVRDHCTLLLTDCDLTSFFIYVFLLSCLILVYKSSNTDIGLFSLCVHYKLLVFRTGYLHLDILGGQIASWTHC